MTSHPTKAHRGQWGPAAGPPAAQPLVPIGLSLTFHSRSPGNRFGLSAVRGSLTIRAPGGTLVDRKRGDITEIRHSRMADFRHRDY
jgi:hypothetical protein